MIVTDPVTRVPILTDQGTPDQETTMVLPILPQTTTAPPTLLQITMDLATPVPIHMVQVTLNLETTSIPPTQAPTPTAALQIAPAAMPSVEIAEAQAMIHLAQETLAQATTTGHPTLLRTTMAQPTLLQITTDLPTPAQTTMGLPTLVRTRVRTQARKMIALLES